MQVLSPVSGRVMPLSEVPDPVFAGAMVGPGVGIDPVREAGTAVAPVAGTLVKLHPHAYVIAGERGSVLVHLGVDTVQLKGEGFSVHATEGAQVAAGEAIVSWDAAAVEAGGKSPAVPVVAIEGSADSLQGVVPDSDVGAGDVLFVWD